MYVGELCDVWLFVWNLPYHNYLSVIIYILFYPSLLCVSHVYFKWSDVFLISDSFWAWPAFAWPDHSMLTPVYGEDLPEERIPCWVLSCSVSVISGRNLPGGSGCSPLYALDFTTHTMTPSTIIQLNSSLYILCVVLPPDITPSIFTFSCIQHGMYI